MYCKDIFIACRLFDDYSMQDNNSPKPDDGDLEENVVALENVAKKRAFSPIQSPVKKRKPVETLPIESNSTASPTRKSKRQRIEAPKIVESKLEPKVYLNKAGMLLLLFLLSHLIISRTCIIYVA